MCLIRARGVERVEHDVLVVSIDRLTHVLRVATGMSPGALIGRFEIGRECPSRLASRADASASANAIVRGCVIEPGTEHRNVAEDVLCHP
jgi:hypothetical protein